MEGGGWYSLRQLLNSLLVLSNSAQSPSQRKNKEDFLQSVEEDTKGAGENRE